MGAPRQHFETGHALQISVYSACLSLGLLVGAPWWLTRMATTRRYREGLPERLGAVPARLRAAVAGKHVVWVHAVSVGEVLAVSRFVGELETALNATPQPDDASHPTKEAWTVVISTTTRTGQALARERLDAERVFYVPLDFAFAVRAYLRALRPALLVLAESELWPRLLHECKHAAIPVAVVNARVSDRSFRRALRVRKLWERMGRKVSLWLAQSEEDARRLTLLGAREGSVQVSGNLKYDVRPPKVSQVAKFIEAAIRGRSVLVAGSTVAGQRRSDVSEDSVLMNAWAGQLREAGVVLVLAPRHPENFTHVYSIAKQYTAVLASEMLKDPKLLLEDGGGLRDGERHSVEVIVLDTIGDLAAVYRLADIAFVGGSLVRKGGHNPLEPAQFGVPIVMGPSFENFRDIVVKLQTAEAICIVRDAEDLLSTLKRLLKDKEAANAMGQRGRRVYEQEQGATAYSVASLYELLAKITATSPDGTVLA